MMGKFFNFYVILELLFCGIIIVFGDFMFLFYIVGLDNYFLFIFCLLDIISIVCGIYFIL